MALIDKVKAQAAQLAQKAQEAGKAGQAKLEDVQLKRRVDGLYRELGAAVYAQRAGHATDNAAEVDRLVDELAKIEAENGPLGAAGDGGADDASDDASGGASEG